jgi:hypothetical protein
MYSDERSSTGLGEAIGLRAVVVYESLWGNTAAIARAIAEGLGPDVRAMTTDEATPAVVADADLIVAGAPVLGFSLPTDQMLEGIRKNPGNAPRPADLSHPSMRHWLETLPAGRGRCAAFETRIRGPVPGSATKAILAGLEGKGYTPAAEKAPFYVGGKYGPLRDGEVEKARAWGAELARTMS